MIYQLWLIDNVIFFVQWRCIWIKILFYYYIDKHSYFYKIWYFCVKKKIECIPVVHQPISLGLKRGQPLVLVNLCATNHWGANSTQHHNEMARYGSLVNPLLENHTTLLLFAYHSVHDRNMYQAAPYD